LCVTRFTSNKASPTTNPKTLTTMKLTLKRECYCESRSLIDENNGSVVGFFPPRNCAKSYFCSGNAASIWRTFIFIIQLVFKLCCFHHPAST